MLAGGPFGLGLPELLVILVVLVLVFGVNKVGDLGGALGKSVREFRKASKEDDGSPPMPAPGSSNNSAPPADVTTTRYCTNCGAQLNADAKFCAQCGTPAPAAVS